MQSKSFEALIGAIVLGVAAAFFSFGYLATSYVAGPQYTLKASFDSVEGLSEGGPVNMGGVQIGTIKSIRLNPGNYLADIIVLINKAVPIPCDSRASIVSNGLLGGKYLAIQPGNSESYLKEGEQIEHTDSSVNFESLLSKAIFSSKKSTEE
jgi:phospholipid/cholesterol/gamma-HCH transport system substrate-binding protein